MLDRAASWISRHTIFFFIGGGQDFEQEVLLRDLAGGKARDIRAAVEDEKVFFGDLRRLSDVRL